MQDQRKAVSADFAREGLRVKGQGLKDYLSFLSVVYSSYNQTARQCIIIQGS